MASIDFQHPLPLENKKNYLGEDLYDYYGRNLLVLLRENSKKEKEIYVPGFIEEYNYKIENGMRFSKIGPVPSAKRKDVEYFIRSDCKYGTTEEMFFLNVEVEPKGYPKLSRSVTGEIPVGAR